VNDVTLHISLTPADLPHARVILPHQVRQLGSHVSTVMLTIDAKTAEEIERQPLLRWLETLGSLHPDVIVRDVDHSDAARARVGDVFFGGHRPPRIDFRGRPIHSYLEPVLAAPTDWVLHLDSDMFIGGGSQTWVREACARLTSDPRLVLASPYPGPPRLDRKVLRQPDAEYIPQEAAILVANMSSRVFLAHVPTFVERLAPIGLLRAPLKGRLWTLRHPNPPFQKLELAVTARMRAQSLRRIDLLGSPPGMWSLHPPYRTREFYERLPELVARVENDDFPLEQRGDFDLNESAIDWSAARRRLRRERMRTMILGRRA
jgi:hypothetical protein